MTSSIPLLLIGKGEAYIDAVIQILQPEFDVIKTCTETSQAAAFFSMAMEPDKSDNTKPVLVVMGAGFNSEDFETISNSSTKGKNQVLWFRPIHFKPGYAGVPPQGGPPTPDVVASRIRTSVEENMTMILSGPHSGQILYY